MWGRWGDRVPLNAVNFRFKGRGAVVLANARSWALVVALARRLAKTTAPGVNPLPVLGWPTIGESHTRGLQR